jgi:glycosyltransferase involved in cell wall biosynthesis
MSHAVDTDAFNPEFRTRQGGPFQIGYVGRLTAEKNVRMLARLEQALLAMGHRDFQIVVVGQGAEEKWLRENMKHVEFTGLLTGHKLSQAFANLDLLAFPSETDTFGLVVLEAFASGVPAVVTSGGGPKFTVRHGHTGYAAATFDEFASFTSQLMSRPDLHSAMCAAAREQALKTSWDRIFEGVYEAYGARLFPSAVTGQPVFDTATI